MKWYPFDPQKFGRQKLPKEKRVVLVQLDNSADESYPPAVCLGYLKYGAGDKQSPYFVRFAGGRTGEVTHWCDCLGDDFESPPSWNWDYPNKWRLHSHERD